MQVLIVIAGIVLLILLVAWFKVNSFLSFIVVTLATGLGLGMTPQALITSLQAGLGNTLGFIALILGFGSMLGKIIIDSGAAESIVQGLSNFIGKKYIIIVFMITGFILGISLFYSVGFILLVPITIIAAQNLKIPTLRLSVPLIAALSITHGFLPPHPAPAALVNIYHADMGKTIIYGIIAAIPVLLSAYFFSKTINPKFGSSPLVHITDHDVKDKLPSFRVSLMTALLPVLLILSGNLRFINIPLLKQFSSFFQFIGNPVVAMLIALIVALYCLGIRQEQSFKKLMDQSIDAIKDISPIILIIGGAGALNQVMTDSGVNTTIAGLLSNLNLSPLILAWLVAAVMRIAIGSATIAAMTAAGMVAPLVQQTGVNPELMVIATGAGSLILSQVNDSGFWLFKEYFNLSIGETFKTMAVMETIISITGLACVLIMNSII
jgi:Gnt-I system high-affinity gluconate transporter